MRCITSKPCVYNISYVTLLQLFFRLYFVCAFRRCFYCHLAFHRTHRLTTSFHFCSIFLVDDFPNSPIQRECVCVCVIVLDISFSGVNNYNSFVYLRSLRTAFPGYVQLLYLPSQVAYYCVLSVIFRLYYFEPPPQTPIHTRHMKATTQIECKHKNICRLIFVERANVTSNLQMNLMVLFYYSA